MLRAGVLVLAVVGCWGRDCLGEQCPATQDTSNLIQQHKLIADKADWGGRDSSSEKESAWSFKNDFFDNLVDKLNPDAITEKIGSIIEDSSISLDNAQDKLYGLAHKFGTRLNKTIEAASERIGSLQKELNEKGRKVKDKSLVQAVTMVTKLGDAAVDVAHKVKAEVELGQLKVRQMVTMLKSEKLESKRQQLQQSLDLAMTTLTGLVHALRDTMRRSDGAADLMQLDANATSSLSEPELTRATIAKAEDLLHRTDELLDDAKVYIDFVESRVNAARAEAERLVKAAHNRSDAVFDFSDQLAEDVIRKLGEIDDMLQGKMSVIEARAVLKQEHSAAPRRAVSLMASLGAVLAMSM